MNNQKENRAPVLGFRIHLETIGFGPVFGSFGATCNGPDDGSILIQQVVGFVLFFYLRKDEVYVLVSVCVCGCFVGEELSSSWQT